MIFKKITEWADKWLVTFNPIKTESMIISRKKTALVHPPLNMYNQQIIQVDFHRHLGINLSNNCLWHSQIDLIKNKAWPKINILKKIKFTMDRKTLEIIYMSFIRSLLEYADTIWDNCTNYEKDDLDKIQHEAARIVTGTTKLVSIDDLYNETGWETLTVRRRKHKLILLYKMINGLTPPYLTNLVPPSTGRTSTYNLRNNNNIQTIYSRTNLYYNSFLPSSIREWNTLPVGLRNSTSLNNFKRMLNLDVRKVPLYYFLGSRKAHILHTRLRTNWQCTQSPFIPHKI